MVINSNKMNQTNNEPILLRSEVEILNGPTIRGIVHNFPGKRTDTYLLDNSRARLIFDILTYCFSATNLPDYIARSVQIADSVYRKNEYTNDDQPYLQELRAWYLLETSKNK